MKNDTNTYKQPEQVPVPKVDGYQITYQTRKLL